MNKTSRHRFTRKANKCPHGVFLNIYNHMSQFLVLFREPDGRTDTHSPEYLDQHRKNMKEWIEKAVAAKQLTGGLPLTLQGKVIKGPRPSAGQPTQQKVSEGPYTVGTEIVGGYMFIEAPGLEEAAALIQTCPIFDSGGFAEVREVMNNPPSPGA